MRTVRRGISTLAKRDPWGMCPPLQSIAIDCKGGHMPQGSRLARVLMPRLTVLIFVAAGALAIFVARPAHAIDYTYPEGCYYCKKVGMFSSDCFVPTSGNAGTSTTCTLTTFLLNTLCY